MFKYVTVPPPITSRCSVSSALPSLPPFQHVDVLPPPAHHPSSPHQGRTRLSRPCRTPQLPLSPPAHAVPWDQTGLCATRSCRACARCCLPCPLRGRLCLHRPLPATGGERCSTQQAVPAVTPHAQRRGSPPALHGGGGTAGGCGCAPEPPPGRALPKSGAGGPGLPAGMVPAGLRWPGADPQIPASAPITILIA